jgi:HD-like signal output (HDOD) protein
MNFGLSQSSGDLPGGPKKLFKALKRMEMEESRGAASPVVDGEAAEARPENTELGPLAKLPPFRPVVISLLRMLDRDDVAAADVARLVESDAALVAELLALVNSPLFGVQGSVSSAAHGVTMLGIERTRSLVTTLAMRAMMSSAPRTPVVRRFWAHSTASAIIARELAPQFELQTDLAHIAAMMHDLGRMGLLAAHTDEYTRLALTAWETVDEILAAEEERFEMNHCQAGLMLTRAWGLPPILQEVTSQHHGAPRGRSMLSLIQLSCRLADDFMFQAILQRGSHKPEETIVRCAPEGLRKQIAVRMEEIQTKVIDGIQALDF